MVVFLNGRFVPEAEAVVPVNDRGFLLGDGLFETVRVANGKPFRFDRHLERLARGADFLKITIPFTPNEVQSFAAQLIQENNTTEAVLRLTLTRGTGRRGYSIRGVASPTLAMALHPLPPVNASHRLHWRLITSTYRIPADDPLAAFKTTSKVLNILARAEAEAKDADEALLLNTNGEVAETAGGNLFWVYEDQICTAPAGGGVLPGITRAIVLEICQSLYLATNLCAVKPEILRRAEAIFVTQSALGIIPVTSFDGRPVAPSPLVAQLAAAYHRLQKRETA